MDPEFERYAKSYEELLDDPIRNRFVGGQSDFFHRRKADLIRNYFRNMSDRTGLRNYLDLGCGKGELVSLLQPDFASVAGCDPSTSMLVSARGIEMRVQPDPAVIPFEDGRFDFVTAVCVYHHVPVAARPNLTREVRRVLKPGGIFCVIEHNPFNPIVQLIVRRTPVDADAVLLRSSETCRLMRDAGFSIESLEFFLYLPKRLYSAMGAVERAFTRVPAGGQYAVFGTLAGCREEAGLLV
jgi:SAM-dependent methyltransferase